MTNNGNSSLHSHLRDLAYSHTHTRSLIIKNNRGQENPRLVCKMAVAYFTTPKLGRESSCYILGTYSQVKTQPYNNFRG